MFIFRHSIKKMLTSWSTWIILGVAVLSTIILAVTFTHVYHNESLNPMKIVSGGIIETKTFWAIAGFIVIFISIFTGFKSAQLIRGEIEDGTLLLILSKPISRQQIVFQKWLSIIVINLIFSFSIFFILLLYFAIFPLTISKNLRAWNASKYLKVSFIFWALLFIALMLFSGFSVLFSLFFSSTITIGSSIAVGILMPIMSVISIFSISKTYKSLVVSQDALINTDIYAMRLRDSIKDLKFSSIEREDERIKSEIDKNILDIYNFNDDMESIYKNDFGILALGRQTNPYSSIWMINPKEILFTLFYGAIQPIEDIEANINNIKISSNIMQPHFNMQWVKEENSFFNQLTNNDQRDMFYKKYVEITNKIIDNSSFYVKLILNMTSNLSESLIENGISNLNKFIPTNNKINEYYPVSGIDLLDMVSNHLALDKRYVYENNNKSILADEIKSANTYFIKKKYINSLLMSLAAIKTNHARNVVKNILNDLSMQGSVNQELINFINKNTIVKKDINSLLLSFIDVDSRKDQLNFLVTNTSNQINKIINSMKHFSKAFRSDKDSTLLNEINTVFNRTLRYPTILHSEYLDQYDLKKKISKVAFDTAEFFGNMPENEWLIEDKRFKYVAEGILNGNVDEIKARPYGDPKYIALAIIGITIALIITSSMIMIRKDIR